MRAWKTFLGVVAMFLALTYASPETSTARAQNLTINIPGVGLTDIKEFAQAGVPIATTVDLFTVPANQILVITDLMITNDNATPADALRIFRSNNQATSFITVAPHSTFAHTFATGILFLPGDTLRVRNGGSAASATFYLRGFLLSIP